MREAAAALFGAGFTVAGCYAAGALVIDRLRVALRRDERIPLAFVLGDSQAPARGFVLVREAQRCFALAKPRAGVASDFADEQSRLVYAHLVR